MRPFLHRNLTVSSAEPVRLLSSAIWCAGAATILVTFPWALSNCAYEPCSELERGEQIRVSIDEIIQNESCFPPIDFGVGTKLDLTVAGRLRGERCESATGSVVETNGQVFFRELPITDESAAYGSFFGHYSISEVAVNCTIWLELAISFDLDGSTTRPASIEGEWYSSGKGCDDVCAFAATGTAQRL